MKKSTKAAVAIMLATAAAIAASFAGVSTIDAQGEIATRASIVGVGRA